MPENDIVQEMQILSPSWAPVSFMTCFIEVTLLLLGLLCSMLEFRNVIIFMRGLGHISHGQRVIVNSGYVICVLNSKCGSESLTER